MLSGEGAVLERDNGFGENFDEEEQLEANGESLVILKTAGSGLRELRRERT